MDGERMAEKLRDPETYYAKWKGDKDYLENKEKDKYRSPTQKEREKQNCWIMS